MSLSKDHSTSKFKSDKYPLLIECIFSLDVSTTIAVNPAIEVPPDTIPIQGSIHLKEWYYFNDLMDPNSSMSEIYAKTICTEVKYNEM